MRENINGRFSEQVGVIPPVSHSTHPHPAWLAGVMHGTLYSSCYYTGFHGLWRGAFTCVGRR